MNKTSIEWTQRPGTVGMTWNPIRARRKSTGKTGTFCTKISPGCKNCYASGINKRFGTGLGFEVPNLDEHEFFIDEKILYEPELRQKPCTIFVGDMFDLFHEAIPPRLVGRVFGVMAKSPQHTFQVLTKRAKYMMEILMRFNDFLSPEIRHPLPNVWVGVSVENQEYADERIPFLLHTPATVRFISVEPLLEEIDLQNLNLFEHVIPQLEAAKIHEVGKINPNYPTHLPFDCLIGTSPHGDKTPAINWVICGGESGPGARPFQLEWAQSLLNQCRDVNVPFFMKQVGSHPMRMLCGQPVPIKLTHGKGGNPEEWPGEYRVREFPR